MTPERDTHSPSLATTWFLLAIGVLIVNDFLLKHVAPGVVTGKLSDVGGLFAAPFFFSVFLPRYPAFIYAATAVAFVIWKLPDSAGAVRAWNSYAPIAIDRVADTSDLVALAILPLSYLSFRRSSASGVRRTRREWAIACIALLAFTATSYRTLKRMDQKFVFQGSPDDLARELEAAGVVVYQDGRLYSAEVPESGWALRIPSEICFDSVDAYIEVHESASMTEIHLRGMAHHCPEGRNDATRLRDEFRTKVAEPLALTP